MKRAFALFLSIAIFLSFFGFQKVHAAGFNINDVPRAAGDPSGTCGDSLKWFISTKTDTLYIYGSGTMYDYTTNDYMAPWYVAVSAEKKASHIYIDSGVRSIGEFAFYYLDEIKDVSLPSGLSSIGIGAFYNCTGIKKLLIPGSVTKIDTYAFYGMTGLTDIRLPNCTYTNRMMMGCSSLKTMYFNPKMTSSAADIAAQAFDGCSSISKVYFPGSRTEWDSKVVSRARSMDSEEILNAEIICDYENHFLDVPYEASYLPYVNWAYQNGVIQGTTADTFGPDEACRRCDLAVMLYRMFGKPSVSGQSIPFTDVKSSDYYYKAVLWAYNKGYIKGTSDTKFNPKGSITRQDMVVILWRIDGDLTGKLKKPSITNPFKDVKKGHYAYNAIMWAYQKGITKGTTSTTFSPTSNCLRYQLAVFLNKFNKIDPVI
ncbi:MAG: S-layer homology domain-containing protein [Clostridia bacterium]|nr:S-layer homology domain-containing protein [Clostridia bacterium]